jgi:TolB-like protein
MRPSPPGLAVNPSIAVLPFDNLDADIENDRLSDGLTNAIITRLSTMEGLRVSSRISSRRYADTPKSIQEIGNELGVASILEGTVQRQGDQIQINARLIDVRSDSNLWAETYNREVSDIIAVQGDISQQIASALQLELTPREQFGIEKNGSPSEAKSASEHFKRGRYFYKLGLMEEAEFHLKKVKEMDPESLSYPQLLLARIYEGKGDSSSALQELNDFLENHPDAPLRSEVEGWKESLLAEGIEAQ